MFSSNTNFYTLKSKQFKQKNIIGTYYNQKTELMKFTN